MTSGVQPTLTLQPKSLNTQYEIPLNQRTHGNLHPVAWPGSLSSESKSLPTRGDWGGLDEKWPLTGLSVWTLDSQLVLFRRCDLVKEVCPQGRLWETAALSYFRSARSTVISLLPAPTTMFAPCCHASTLRWMKVSGTVSQNKLFLKLSLFIMLYHCDWTAATAVAQDTREANWIPPQGT